MSPTEAAGRGLRDRAVADATLLGFLGSAGRVVPGWPGDTKAADDFPRLTYFVVAADVRRPGTETIRFQLDAWAWPETGGWGQVEDIDERLVQLFDEQHWTYGGHRLYALCLSARDYPAAPGYALRRRRDLEIRASPA